MKTMSRDSDIKYEDEEHAGPISLKASFILSIWRKSIKNYSSVQKSNETQRYLGGSCYESGLQTVCHELEFFLEVPECWFMTVALHSPPKLFILNDCAIRD